MNFLLVNDDGIEAEGIKALASALAKQGNVYVCAPNTQQSGKSHSITLEEKIIVKQVEFPDAQLAWITSGTPSDCTKVGLQMCEKNCIDVDMVFSGINMGSNLGTDTIYSGTVGAAMEAAMKGYKAVAVSVNGHHAKHFDGACKVATDIIDYINKEVPSNIIININSPDKPLGEIKGVKAARLGTGFFEDKFVNVGGEHYKLKGVIPNHKEADDELDLFHNAHDYITLTPLRFDFTDYEYLDRVKDWRIDL